jgi:hypothetical protein
MIDQAHTFLCLRDFTLYRKYKSKNGSRPFPIELGQQDCCMQHFCPTIERETHRERVCVWETERRGTQRETDDKWFTIGCC